MLRSLNQENLEAAPTWLRTVYQQASSLRFGVVQIVVHGSRVVLIERTERLRMDEKVGSFGDQITGAQSK